MSISVSTRQNMVGQAQALCRDHGASLLFLTLFGSTLYGTETPGTSDLDVRGIFLPSPDSLFLNDAPKSLHFSTGTNGSRNSADDLDMDLWSVQHWLLKLLPAGDTGAMDLLFSPSHAACTLYRDAVLDAVFASPLRLMDTARGRAYAAYSLGQAKKYGIKGSRVGALKTVRRWLREHAVPDGRLAAHLPALLAACGDDRFCTAATVQGEPALQLCGKRHAGGIRLAEFARRVENDMRRYGGRAEEAERNHGLDFKALSHALRALVQMEELLQTGRIVFPLREREALIAVKQGRHTWAELEPRILSRLADVDALRERAPFVGAYDADFARRCVLAYYGRSQAPRDAMRTDVCEEGFSVPPATWEAIQGKLEAAERTHDVKVLYACESGSRGWGFASDDSDFDVRFLYVHRPDWYLGVAPEEKRDVLELGIERTPAGELDINGWELRKALKLFRQSNPPLLEWLSSPIVYRESGPAASLLRAAMPSSLSPLRAWHHYRSLMEKSLIRWEKKTTVKTWFYILRPLLAMRWLEFGRGAPPMRFDRLVEGTIDDSPLRRELDAVVVLKRQGGERDAFVPPPLAAAFMENEWRRLREKPPLLPRGQQGADLDATFRAVLADAWPQEFPSAPV